MDSPLLRHFWMVIRLVLLSLLFRVLLVVPFLGLLNT